MAWSAPETRFAMLSTGRGALKSVDFPMTHVGVRWQGSEEAVVQARWLEADGHWSAWEDMPVAHDLDDEATGTTYSGLVRVDDARKVETRVAFGDAHNITVAAIDTENGPRKLVVKAAPGTSSATASIAEAKVPAPAIITRAQWGADESKRSGTPGFAPLKKLIVHHTDTSNNDADPAGTVRAIYAYHTGARGWSDIGYNFLVDAAGRVYEGRWARAYAANEVHNGEDTRGYGVIGAHAEGANTGSVGVALLGNFTSTSPTSSAINALQNVLAWKADRHDIDPLASSNYTKFDGTVLANLPNISGHRDTKSTSCPGDVLWNKLPQIRQAVQKVVAQAHGTTPGYWVASRDGNVIPFGAAGSHGTMAGYPLNAPIVGMTATMTGKGYWLLGRDGGIFSFGDAVFHGSMGGYRLNAPVISMAATPTGRGYWLVGADGGIFSFGDAVFHGSTGGMPLNAPVLGMAATPTGRGYWLFARDGGIFSFGDAVFHGSTGGMRLNSPVTGMDADQLGRGYWMVARDGGMFAFDVPYHGSVPGLGLASYAGAISMKATETGRGYYVLATDGGVLAFGDARDYGSKYVAAGAAGIALVQDPSV